MLLMASLMFSFTWFRIGTALDSFCWSLVSGLSESVVVSGAGADVGGGGGVFFTAAGVSATSILSSG